MSTIASPRDTSINGRKLPQLSTPTSSSRPSLELPQRSTSVSPNPSTHTRRNRAALRSYYNLKSPSQGPSSPAPSSPTSSIHAEQSDTPSSILDSPSFDSQAYITHVLETQTLGELLKTYNGVLTDIRALDAEKKALVYDNYSKLIAATETIGRMRENMDPLNPMARTLDLAVVGIWETARGMREEMRRSLEAGGGSEEVGGQGSIEEKRRRRREVVRGVLETPERVRALVKEGREEEARTAWESSLRLLERWKERGVGGDDVGTCIEDGKAALRGEPPSEKI